MKMILPMLAVFCFALAGVGCKTTGSCADKCESHGHSHVDSKKCCGTCTKDAKKCCGSCSKETPKCEDKCDNSKAK